MNVPAAYDGQLVQSGKLAVIGELAAGVAHEINNPLFAILALSEFLLKELEPGSRQYERAELIHSTGLEIKEIVRGLLEFARDTSDELVLVSLDEIVRQTVDLMRRTNMKKGIALVERYDPVMVEASSGEIRQVVLNLLGNARAATPDGGRIAIDVLREGSEALVRIADDGPGVDPAVRSADLGLALSSGIAQRHGGSLSLEPSPDGMTFVLRLPVA